MRNEPKFEFVSQNNVPALWSPPLHSADLRVFDLTQFFASLSLYLYLVCSHWGTAWRGWRPRPYLSLELRTTLCRNDQQLPSQKVCSSRPRNYRKMKLGIVHTNERTWHRRWKNKFRIYYIFCRNSSNENDINNNNNNNVSNNNNIKNNISKNNNTKNNISYNNNSTLRTTITTKLINSFCHYVFFSSLDQQQQQQ